MDTPLRVLPSDCCAPAVQATCCVAAEKTECCLSDVGTGGCGCTPGQRSVFAVDPELPADSAGTPATGSHPRNARISC